jgi:hypothetical protein
MFGQGLSDSGKAQVARVLVRNVGSTPPRNMECLYQQVSIVSTNTAQVSIQVSEQVGPRPKTVVDGGSGSVEVVPERPN